MPLASPATPARNRRARLASQPHLAWVFALQGANQNLSAFSIARLDAARISRDPSEKSPCTTCIPAASGLAFRPSGCEPKPVRFFHSPVWIPPASPATPARNRRARLVSQPHLAWLFALQGANQNLSAFSIARLDAARISLDLSEKSPCTTCIPAASGLAFRPPGCEPKPVRFFNRLSGCRSHLPRPQQEIAVHDLHPNRIWLGFSPSRVRTKTCPLFQPPVWMP